ncbi:hypothetical protein [Paenarthrobacter sp. YIM B13468]
MAGSWAGPGLGFSGCGRAGTFGFGVFGFGAVFVGKFDAGARPERGRRT